MILGRQHHVCAVCPLPSSLTEHVIPEQDRYSHVAETSTTCAPPTLGKQTDVLLLSPLLVSLQALLFVSRGKKIALHRGARTQTSYLLSSQKVESLLLLCPSAASCSLEPQGSQQRLSPRIFTSSSQCGSFSILFPLFALSDMRKVKFYRHVPLFRQVLQPPLYSPLSNRALRIHFVGLSLLCRHTTGSSLHQRVFMKDSKKKKIPLLSAGETLKAAKPRVSGRRETQCWHPWSCRVYMARRRGESWGAAEKKGVREDEQKSNSNDGNNRQMWAFARRCRK